MRAIGSIFRMWSDIHYADFTDSLVEMMLFSTKVLCKSDEFIHYDKATYSWHAGARNQLVEKMEGDWLLQLDCDHRFAPDLAVRLHDVMRKEGCNIVSGIYQYKDPNSGHGPVAGFWDENWHFNPMVDWDRSAESIDVGAVGGGCLLVKGEVFRRMRAKFKCEPFDQIGGMSEDFSFCKRAIEMGERVVLCPQIENHHQIRTLLSVRDIPKRLDVRPVQIQGGLILNAPPPVPPQADSVTLTDSLNAHLNSSDETSRL